MSLRAIEFLDSSGHLSLEWDSSDPASVENARAEFETLRQAGYSFFRVVSQQVDGFDPQHGALEVRRVDASEVEPHVEPVAPIDATSPLPQRHSGRGRSGKKATAHPPVTQQEGRVVAARPMRGG